jgi:hypothetical protein
MFDSTSIYQAISAVAATLKIGEFIHAVLKKTLLD